uniref:Triacylglycerol lipase n=1 Tax=Quercus lobata TaxID=97700 RepID=A0A7N2MAG5_QUELO
MKMDYTSNTLLLAVLLFASAVAVNSQDSLCKSMVETNGYVCEEHKGTTPNTNTSCGRSQDAATWLFNSPDKSLEFILADNGFDAYWERTWAQLANDDLPAMYDYIHNQTGQKLYYVGHSLGTLLALASFSQEKLVNLTKSAALLCPIAYTSQTTSVFPRTIAKAYLAESMSNFSLKELSVNLIYDISTLLIKTDKSAVGRLLEGVCHLPLIDCSNLVSAIAGPNCCIKPPTYDVVLDHTPQSTSTKNMVHLAQMLRAGNVAEYDYDDENDLKDRQNDKLVLLYRDDYAHLDFIAAQNAKSVVYDPLIAL